MSEQINHPAHILFLLTQDLHSPSGLGRYFPWAKYLVREGFKVTILALHANFADLPEKQFVQDDVNVRYVAQMHVRKANNRTHYFSPTELLRVTWQATHALYRAGKQEDADLILVAKPHPMNGIAGLRLARRKGVPLVVDHDDYEAESNHTSSRWQKLVLKHFEDTLPKRAALVTTNTYFNKKRLVNLGIAEAKIHYLPNGVDTDRFQTVSGEEVGRLKQELSLTGKKVIGYLGSLSLANHPVDVLMRTFSEISDSAGETRLLIVGGGKDLDKLKALAEELGVAERVVFTGRVRPDEMSLYYQLADISVDPVNNTLADHGRCPLKIFESWQMGVPVFSADVGDRKILAGEPAAILLANPKDPQDFSAKLGMLIRDEGLLAQMRAAGLERIQQFTWEGIVRRSVGIFESLLRSQPEVDE